MNKYEQIVLLKGRRGVGRGRCHRTDLPAFLYSARFFRLDASGEERTSIRAQRAGAVRSARSAVGRVLIPTYPLWASPPPHSVRSGGEAYLSLEGVPLAPASPSSLPQRPIPHPEAGSRRRRRRRSRRSRSRLCSRSNRSCSSCNSRSRSRSRSHSRSCSGQRRRAFCFCLCFARVFALSLSSSLPRSFPPSLPPYLPPSLPPFLPPSLPPSRLCCSYICSRTQRRDTRALKCTRVSSLCVHFLAIGTRSAGRQAAGRQDAPAGGLAATQSALQGVRRAGSGPRSRCEAGRSARGRPRALWCRSAPSMLGWPPLSLAPPRRRAFLCIARARGRAEGAAVTGAT